MARPVTLKVGQYLLLLASVAAICAGGGMLLQAIYWHLPFAARSSGFLIMLGGQLSFVVLGIWKSVDDWTARTTGRPLGY
jgi:hypothetical protein